MAWSTTDIIRACLHDPALPGYLAYSRVPNKRGRVRIIGVLEMVRYNNDRGLGIIGGGVLGEIENSPFLR